MAQSKVLKSTEYTLVTCLDSWYHNKNMTLFSIGKQINKNEYQITVNLD